MNRHAYSAHFIKSGTAPEHYPELELPEIAIAGRSNVGKSSLINRIVGQRRLAKVSGTPGRTQLLNFFEVGIDAQQSFVLCDLPGYGYAKVPKAIREAWGPMIETYLAERERLTGLMMLMDARREPDALESVLVEFCSHHGRAVVPVVTKIDKLPKSKRKLAVQKIARALGLPPRQLLPWSALSGEGGDAVWAAFVRLANRSAGA